MSAFTVNALLLYVFKGILSLPLLIAQLLGAEGTILYSFVLHHNWTYQKYSQDSLPSRFIKFNLSAVGGLIISTACVLFFTLALHLHYLLGLAIGAVLATSWNYLVNSYYIWKKDHVKADPYSQDYLIAEAKLFSKYLIGNHASQVLLERYAKTVRSNPVEVIGKDYKILQTKVHYPFLLGLLDAGCAVKYPQTELRRRLFICFAILEASPEYTSFFLPQNRKSLYFLRIVMSGLGAPLKGMTGVILLLFV